MEEVVIAKFCGYFTVHQREYILYITAAFSAVTFYLFFHSFSISLCAAGDAISQGISMYGMTLSSSVHTTIELNLEKTKLNKCMCRYWCAHAAII